MANTFGSISNAAGLFKIYYAGPVKSQFNDVCPLYKGAETGKEKYNGVQVNRPIKVRRNFGVGATSDGGTLPTIGKQNVQQAVILAKFNYLRFGMTGPAIKASQGNAGSFASLMEFEMEQGMLDIKTNINRQLFFTGRGDIGVVSAAAVATNTLSVTGRTTGENGNKYIDVGSVIDIYDSATDTLLISGATVVSATDGATSTVVLDQNVTVAANTIIVQSGSYNAEIQGIRTVLDNATTSVYGVARSSFPVYNGNVIDAAGGQLRLDLMQQTLNECRRRAGAKIDAIFCDYNAERFYNKLLVADRRYIGQKVKGDGSFTDKDQSYLEFAGAPITPDKDCTGSEFYFMPQAGWKKYVLADLEWADETGSNMIAQVSSDSFEVRLRLFANMFPEMPSGMGRLTNFASP